MIFFFFFITSNGLSIILIDPTPQKEKVEERKTASKDVANLHILNLEPSLAINLVVAYVNNQQ